MSKEFWNQHPDRHYMKNVLYPEIGLMFRDTETKRVLDVGVQDYNKNNKDLFGNDDIEYWQIDDGSDEHSLSYREDVSQLSCDKFIRTSMVDLPKNNPETKNYFDCVISIGVIGFYVFDFEFTDLYLDTVHSCLKENGTFYLHTYTRDLESLNINESKLLQLFDIEKRETAGVAHFYKTKKKD